MTFTRFSRRKLPLKILEELTFTHYEACQIDYLIQTRESIYACEIKFSKHKVGNGIIAEMKSKLEKLKVPKYMSKRAVLIHVNGVTDDVSDALFFTQIIDFGDLLHLTRV